MNERTYKFLLISDFNIDNLAGLLSNDSELPRVEAVSAPFGQVIPVLMQGNSEYWLSKPDFAVVWTQAETTIPTFKDVSNYKEASLEKILGEVDGYSSLLLDIRDRVKFVFVPTWIFPSYHRSFGMLDMRTGIGISNTLMRMNLRLAENFDKASNIYLFDTQKWMTSAGVKTFNPKLWYLGKIPFGNQVFLEAVKDFKSALRGLFGNSKKLVIVDLDNTLWGGIVGDDGWENIRLGGHDYIGEVYVDFQRALKSLTNCGILLGIVSKNEESVALDAIINHPEMVLRLDDFAGWKINWNDKAQNIVDLVSDLNLGLEAVVFIDDNPVERARVREALPEVLVPEWPEDKTLYKSALLALRCFSTPDISHEDRKRTEMYVSQRERESLKARLGSLDEWLGTLNIKVKVEGPNEANLKRATQLLNKTNQMNLTTRRMTESELVNWIGEKNHRLWTFGVSDRFGNSGLIGIASIEVKDNIGRIVDFILSCRVMGRRVEDTMLYTVITHARSIGLVEVRAKYIPTTKNKLCLEFWEKSSGFKFDDNSGFFTWNVKDEYPLPKHIELSEE